MKKILWDNALEAWTLAIHYCDEILKGKVTLRYRKNFVSTLHNAVELFIKQCMLDNNDHRVCRIGKPKKDDPTGYLQNQFDASINLNEYFLHLPAIDADKFYSENYSKICSYTDTLFSKYYQKNQKDKKIVDDALVLLGNLRNSETHFWIDKWSFLKENEFVQLHNFMIVFYEILHCCHLLPFFGETFGKYTELDFSRQEISAFSYKSTIEQSSDLKEIIKLVKRERFYGFGNSIFEITQNIIDLNDEKWKDRTEELRTYIEVALHFKILTIIVENEEFEYEDEDGYRKSAITYYSICQLPK